MQKNIFQIALAGLISNPGVIPGWEADLSNKLGELTDSFGEAIELASKLSTGASRAVGNIDKLQSVFDHISLLDGPRQVTDLHYYAPLPLSLQKRVIFPSKQQQDDNQKPDLTFLLNNIKRALPKSFEETEGFLEEVLSALQRTASNIPSAVLPDVSLYEHQRMTSALAVCLLEKKSEQIRNYLAAVDENTQSDDANTALDEPVALLVGGDISGIQDFIYTVTAKGAARTLRGRSFYLQLLTEAVLRFVLRALEIPYTNVIYSGGGHFFLLAPLSKSERLESIQKQISTILLKHHGTSLYLALGSTAIPLRGFTGGRFPEYWGHMHGSMSSKKQRRYTELGSDAYSQVFSVKELGGNPYGTCDVCGEDYRSTQKWDDLETQDRICSLCFSFFQDIGKKLPRSNFVALGIGSLLAQKTNTALDILADFGMAFQFIENIHESIRLAADQIVVWAFSDPVDNKWPLAENAPKWLRYTANQISQLSFDELQDKVQGGFGRLGVLRMDVDNLGELFKNGLGKHATLTRLATLSSKTSLFFEGWLKQLCEYGKRKGLVYTVYAGGDDVFLLAPWDLIPDLARDIVHDFAEYTGNNPDIHLSAGVAFIDGKYPIYQAADDAKDAIDQAKLLSGKNSFTFLGKPWNWATFDELARKQERLENLVTSKEAGGKDGPQSLLQILQQLSIQEDQHDKIKGRHVWGRWIWMGMYQLTRMQERYKDFSQDIKAISDELKDDQYREIAQWGAAARWTELKIRKKTKKEEAK